MKKTILLFSALVFLAACKPSVKNETRKWENNQKNIQTALAKYPNFAKQVTPILNQAKADWKKASALSKEEEKAEAMRAVNKMFSSGLLNKLTQVISKSKGIDDTIAYVQNKRVSKSVLKKIRKKIASARSKQSEANSILRSADVSTQESATEAVQSAISKLISANSDANKAKKLAKKK